MLNKCLALNGYILHLYENFGSSPAGLYVTGVNATRVCVELYIYLGILFHFMITTIVVFALFYLSIKPLLLGKKGLFKHQDLQMFDLILNK